MNLFYFPVFLFSSISREMSTNFPYDQSLMVVSSTSYSCQHWCVQLCMLDFLELLVVDHWSIIIWSIYLPFKQFLVSIVINDGLCLHPRNSPSGIPQKHWIVHAFAIVFILCKNHITWDEFVPTPCTILCWTHHNARKWNFFLQAIFSLNMWVLCSSEQHCYRELKSLFASRCLLRARSRKQLPNLTRATQNKLCNLFHCKTFLFLILCDHSVWCWSWPIAVLCFVTQNDSII